MERVVTPSGEVQLTGTGYAPEGRMVVDPQTMPLNIKFQIPA